MKQIPFYKGIEKKVVVTGEAIKDGQNYKCVVYSSLTDATTTIYAVAEGKKVPKPECECKCKHDIGTVVFHFNEFQTSKLKEGDNSVAVFDISVDDNDEDYTLYKVYEARAYVSNTVVNVEAQDPTAITFINADQTTGWLKGGRMVNGYLVLDEETIDVNGQLNLT